MSTKQNTKNRRSVKSSRFVVMKSDKRLKGERIRESKRREAAESKREPSQKLQPSGRAYERASKGSAPQRKTPVRIIPLGGLNEIGKNFTVIECSNDMFIIDCGLAFPDSEMLGVDIVIPDFTYVEQNKEKLRGIVLTHGHEDHIGGVPFLLKEIQKQDFQFLPYFRELKFLPDSYLKFHVIQEIMLPISERLWTKFPRTKTQSAWSL